MSFEALETGFEAGLDDMRRVMGRPMIRVVGEPPQIRLGWPQISDIVGV
jgi:hypothetical protein